MQRNMIKMPYIYKNYTYVVHGILPEKAISAKRHFIGKGMKKGAEWCKFQLLEI